jgi:hypothetical protein
MAAAFAGPLSRYYAPAAGDAARLRAGVEAWRQDLRAGVADKVREQLAWDEGADESFAADLGDSGWIALRLFALYAERPDLELPDTAPALLELDPEWRSAQDGKFATSRYGHLLACSAWLPGDFPVTLRVPMPDAESRELGALAVLQDQLRWLNARTFQAGEDEVAAWRELPAPAGGDLLAAARRGYAALLAAVVHATAARVPVVVREP